MSADQMASLRARLAESRPPRRGADAQAGPMVPDRAFGLEELEAVAATARDKGHQMGYVAAERNLRPYYEQQADLSLKYGESRGIIAGLQFAVDGLREQANELVASEDDGVSEEAKNNVIAALRGQADDLWELAVSVAERGIHGELELAQVVHYTQVWGLDSDRVAAAVASNEVRDGDVGEAEVETGPEPGASAE